MRPLLCVLALMLPGIAFAEPRAEPRAEPQLAPRERAPARPLLDERFTEAAQREAEESAARQGEFDRRIAERSARAARSICNGCGGAAGAPVARVTPPGLRRERAEAGLPRDPAQAPLD